MKRLFIILVSVFTIIAIPLPAQHASQIVRVGCYTDDILYKTSDNIYMSSYISDFLSSIGKYGDWKFELVQIDSDSATTMLKNGTVDILPFFGKEADFSSDILFTDMPSAAGALVLAAKKAPDMSYLRIGILDSAPKSMSQKIRKYADEQDIRCSITEFHTTESLLKAIDDGDINTYATIDLGLPAGYIPYASIEIKFLYTAVSCRNKELYDDINHALTLATSLNPSLLTTLRQKYIPAAKSSLLRLTPKENQYLLSHPLMRVAAVTNQPPFCYWQNGRFNGIIIDLLDSVSKTSGITFMYIPAKTYTDALKMVRNGSADAVYSMSDMISKENADAITLTNPMLTQKYSIIRKTADNHEPAAYARAQSSQLPDLFFVQKYHAKQVRQYAVTSDCIHAVQHDGNIVAIIPSLEVRYYKGNHLFTGFTDMSADFITNISLGVSKKEPAELYSILDKSISTLSASMFENYAEKNMTENDGFMFFVSRHPAVVFIISAAFLLTITTIIFLSIIIHTNKKKDRQIQQAMNLANRDTMTGLFNHVAFEKNVSGCLAHADSDYLSVFVMLDIDNFKKVNDTCGHSTGDFVIVSIANIIISTFRQGDLKCRMGGDEFAVFMKNVSDITAISRKMETMLRTIETYFETQKTGVHVTCSAGAAFIPGISRISFAELYAKADEALYTVKKNGKNQFCIIPAEPDAVNP